MVTAVGLAAFLACSPGADGGGGGDGDGGTDSGSGGGSGLDGSGGDLGIDSGDGGNGGNLDPRTLPPTPNCGDGVLNEDEACDDGNREEGDGCFSNCRLIETGFTCPRPGEACLPFARCGDGLVVFPEQCDDGGLEAGDGCSPSCKFEIGWKCSGSPSSCEETICGDSVIEGAETCDDGNDIPFDGCNERCQAEPRCTASGCTSTCGDGLVLGDEQCDDGNRLDGDGCSSTCTKEDGYDCEQASPCKMVGDVCALEIPAVYRDFNASHTDFEVGCGDHVKGLVRDQLDNQGKPVLVTGGLACIDSTSSFGEWYRDVPPKNATIVSSITLFPNSSGGFVNRYGPNGEQWPVRMNEAWASNDASTCNVPGCHPCSWNAGQGCTSRTEYRDGTPLFFPIDDHPAALSDTRYVAGLPGPIYEGGWKDDPSGKLRNFHFTSEVTYWFQYQSGSAATLSFVGDDDVWVFINRRLAIDLGGLHEPISGQLTIAANGNITLVSHEDTTSSNAASFGLVSGGVYEIKVFHAERKKNGSSFQLTLSGFNTSRSECRSNCGDGIIGAGEECDDGVNDGGYNECQPGCKLGGYCGDGIRQENEVCDDNDPARPPNCYGCRIIDVR